MRSGNAARISPYDQFVFSTDGGRIVSMRSERGQLFEPLLESDVGVQAGIQRYLDLRTSANSGKGSNANDGLSWDTPYSTMTFALAAMKDYDTLNWIGTCTEEGLTVPAAKGCSIIGGNCPGYQAGALWKADADSIILTVNQKGWRFGNFKVEPFTGTSSAGFNVTSAGGDALFDTIEFNAGYDGIRVVGADGLRLYNCRFHDMANYAITGTDLTQGWNIRWEMMGCRFINNANHVIAKLDDSWIESNLFQAVGFSYTATTKFDLRGGNQGYNIVHRNFVGGTYSKAGGYYANDNDECGDNWNNGGRKDGRPA